MKGPFTILKDSGRAVSPLTAGGAHGVTRPAIVIRRSPLATRRSGGTRAGGMRSLGIGSSALNVERSSHDLQPSAFRLQPCRRGMALVITVILLAVVTFMAITFLAVSRRERSAVTTTTDTTTAQLASDDALAAAESQIMANTFASTNPYNFGLVVSTNFINAAGFTAGNSSPTNVNYNYYTTAPGPLKEDDFLQNLANLNYLPRPPVYATNYLYNRNELQFYLDLNRNGLDDTNGVVGNFDNNGNYLGNITEVGDPEWIGVLQHPDQPYGPNNPFVARYAFIALPIGNALDLNYIYNDALGIKGNLKMVPGSDGFLRNQGVGSWELNLAAFLADLNTNEWGQVIGSTAWYQYNEASASSFPNLGLAFDDALSLLSYRYGYFPGGTYNLNSANNIFGLNAANVFPYDGIDAYCFGPVMSGFQLPVDNDNTTLAWSGSENTNHFFDIQDLYDTTKTASGLTPAQINGGNDFTGRLLRAGQGNSTYNHYTYYRLLSQLGVDSAPVQNQINLNYSNALATFYPDGTLSNIVYFPNAETNLTPWQPLQFFTIAADKMLRAYSQEWLTENPSNYLAIYQSFTNISTASDPVLNPTNVPVPFGISDIPVLVSNRFVYTPAVQRVLQLAANIYDATTNTYFPTVFRPIFLVTNDPVGYRDVYIAGYEPVGYNGQIGAVSGPSDPQFNLPLDVTSLSAGSAAQGAWQIYTNINVYGVPWIIGAKKGFPNFNEFAMESIFQLTRKLEVTRDSTNDSYGSSPGAFHFNQMFNLSVSNQVGVECWNSYTNNFPDSVAIYASCTNSSLLTNNEGFQTLITSMTSGSLQINSSTNWPGYNPDGSGASFQAVQRSPASFQIPLDAAVTVVTNSTYRFNQGSGVQEPGHSGPYLTTNLNLPFEFNVVDPVTGSFPQPHWWLTSTNDLRVIILDTTVSPNRVLDYVQLSGPNSHRDLTSEIITNWDKPIVSANASGDEFWNTNFQAGVPIGLLSQIGVSLDQYTPGVVGGTWDLSNPDTQNAIDAFRVFFNKRLSPIWNNASGRNLIAAALMTNAMAVPYQPTAMVVQHVDWQANDPLVHYMANDFNYPGSLQYDRTAVSLTTTTNETANLGQLNTRYMPWGGYPDVGATKTKDFNAENAYNLALKDPLVWRSDDWDFPTYRFPTVGWLGRVHRGTPWQTVYLKSPDILREYQVVAGNRTNYVGPVKWAEWTGNSLAVVSGNTINYVDADNAAPVQDRLLFDLFTTAPNDNATRGQLSVNVGASDSGDPQAGLAAWSALFSGVQVLSNDLVNPLAQHNGSMGGFTPLTIDPAGPSGTNSPLGQIVAAINRTRLNADNSARIISVSGSGTVTNEIPAGFGNIDGVRGTFEHVGDILSVPQLSDESPFLTWNNVGQLDNGISDEMYEWLPQQVMSLLRVSGTPQAPMRYVIYSYGQALKPAPNGIYTGSATLANGQSAFGMVTNYQVVAASATRSVVSFNSVVTNVVGITNDSLGNPILFTAPAVTNNTVQIQQFNVLPPY